MPVKGSGLSLSKSTMRDDEEPKRPCTAFGYYMQDHKQLITSFSGDHLKTLWANWNQLDSAAKAPYEAKAADDTRRYRRQKKAYDNARVKKPCTAYTLFIQEFIKNNYTDQDDVRDTLSAGAARWSAMSDSQKAPWKKLATAALNNYKKQKAASEARKPIYSLSASSRVAAKLKKKAIATAVKKSSAKPKAVE